ncbi:YlxR family protein [Corynebacterium bovis]|uniref:YlxR family protein n=1 Tax=Corynebacterium bovis TaxID=36808 RepID=UPI0031390469
MRTCIATRQILPEKVLLRCVASHRPDGTVVILPDPRRRSPGRGAWISPTVDAWETAVSRRAFSRALRVPADADPGPVRDYIGHIGRDHPRQAERTEH